MSVTDVITGTYSRLWAILEASADFAGTPPYVAGSQRDQVWPGNRVKWDAPAGNNRPQKPGGQDGDFPEAMLTVKGGSYELATSTETTIGNEGGSYASCLQSAALTVQYELTITSRLLRIGAPDLLTIAALDAIRQAGQRLSYQNQDCPFVTGVGRIVWTTKDTDRDTAKGTSRLVTVATIPVVHTFYSGDTL